MDGDPFYLISCLGLQDGLPADAFMGAAPVPRARTTNRGIAHTFYMHATCYGHCAVSAK